ncbi:MAG: twin-arginine translocase TatA/TatE family subunit [Acidobacteria bacterium]|nr:MAG: twin-arginine translocase TatA/TatE family subunit [Acidobacteriota bacterium]
MPQLGFQELFLILLIVIVLFGATRLPQLGRGLGEGIRNFKRGLKSGDDGGEPAVEAPRDDS